jgi:hypothetical protein
VLVVVEESNQISDFFFKPVPQLHVSIAYNGKEFVAFCEHFDISYPSVA